MAQAKTRASAKRSGGSRKPPARSRGSSTKTRSNRGTGNAGMSGMAKEMPAKAKAVPAMAKDAGHAVGNAASKGKVPILAGGAALVGAAGGLALGARQARRHHGLGWAIARRPQVKLDSRDLAKAAKEVGSFGAQVGQLASELQRARETANGGRHRSPVEVVLDGLTTRRSRG